MVDLVALRRVAFIAVACGSLVLVGGGCGSDSGATSGATLTVYVSVPLHGPQAASGEATCAGAGRALKRVRPSREGVRVTAVCLDDTGGGPRWTLAAVGANARRATEDSSAIGYVGELGSAPTLFSQPITNAAGVPQISYRGANADRGSAAAYGRDAIALLLTAIRRAGGDGDTRSAVSDQLRSVRDRQSPGPYRISAP
jgi:hypothetical protein